MCAEVMDVSRDEAKRILRRLELEAYSSIVSAFRAQGDLSRDKKKILTDLGLHLSISTERHRAEIRRAFSDDRLGTVADCIYGPSTCAEWAAEGRRLVPLMPRLVPQTVLSATATAAANSAAVLNAKVMPSVSSQGSKSVGSTLPSSSGSANSIVNASSGVLKGSPLKIPSNSGSVEVDKGCDGDDSKAKKRRRLSQSISNPKPIQKIVVTSPSGINRPSTKTASVSTMTKVGKPTVTIGAIRVPPKITLPASASQIKLLTKTVSITQTVCQAKTMLNYKTVSATSPAAVKVQTVMSHTTPKPQVKVTGPTSASPTKTLLVPKSRLLTNPGKPVVGLVLPKTGISTAQLIAKQIGKQAARFKPLLGTVKFKSATPVTMGTCSTVTMVTSSPSSQATPGSTLTTLPVSNSQPIVRVIQVPGTGGLGISKPVVVMTTGLSKTCVPSILPIISAATKIGQKQGVPVVSSGVAGPSILKIPISSTTSIAPHPIVASSTHASRLATTAVHLPTSTPKTVVMTTVVDGTKKVILSIPTSVAPTQAKSSGLVTNTGPPVGGSTKTKGLGTLLIPVSSDPTPKQPPKKQEPTMIPKKGNVTSLECIEPSSVLQAPTHIAPKPITAPTTTTQVRARPLPAILPAPPKHPFVTSTSTGVRKLPTIFPAPVKSGTSVTTVLVPIAPGMTTAAVTTPVPTTKVLTSLSAVKSVASAVPNVLPGSSSSNRVSASTSKGTTAAQERVNNLPDKLSSAEPQCSGVNIQGVKSWSRLLSDKGGSEESSEQSRREVLKEGKSESSKEEHKAPLPEQTVNVGEYDSNTSSDDDSILVCSETIDSGVGLHGLSPTLEHFPGVTPGASPGAIAAESTPSAHTKVNLVTDVDHTLRNTTSVESKKEMSKKDEYAHNIHRTHQNTGVALEKDSNTQSEVFIPLKMPCIGSKSGPGYEMESVDATSHPGEHVKLQDGLQCALTEETKSLPDFGAVSSFLQSFTSSESMSKDILNMAVNTAEVRTDANSSDGLSIQEVHREISNLCTPTENTTDKHQTEINREFQVSPQSSFSLPSSSASSEIGDIIFTIDPSSSHSDHSLEEHSTLDVMNDPLNLDFNVDIMSMHSSSVDTDNKDLTDSEKLTLEAIANVRTSGRKRKAPMPLNLSPPRQTSGWMRGALSLLQKVCTFRGQGRRKGDISAASWFLRPVDQTDAPGYYKVIKTPMDFSTIKTKLETAMYQDYEEFHNDMLLVKTNCLKYNPPGHDVTTDCDEVFKFYEAEYAKMLERWEKCHVSPAKKPRTLSKSESVGSNS